VEKDHVLIRGDLPDVRSFGSDRYGNITGDRATAVALRARRAKEVSSLSGRSSKSEV